jgi:hypothetical protein
MSQAKLSLGAIFFLPSIYLISRILACEIMLAEKDPMQSTERSLEPATSPKASRWQRVGPIFALLLFAPVIAVEISNQIGSKLFLQLATMSVMSSWCSLGLNRRTSSRSDETKACEDFPRCRFSASIRATLSKFLSGVVERFGHAVRVENECISGE